MARKSTPQSLATDQSSSLDPTDHETIDNLYKSAIPEAEQALMFAMLEYAVSDFQRYFVARNAKEKRQCHEALTWMFGKKRDWVFSFENVCENLGLNPNYLRRRLQAWAEENGHTLAPRRQQIFTG
jgi:hypothetical protein